MEGEESMEIIKITIKGSSGFSSVDEAYRDKVTLTPYPISYEYKPDKASRLETNIYRKWSYRTTSPIFSHIYSKVEAKTPSILKSSSDQSQFVPIVYKGRRRKEVRNHP